MKLLGAGGHARVIAETAAQCGIDVEGFIDRDECDRDVEGVKIPSKVETPLFLAIGDNDRRRRMAGNLKAEYPVLVSPAAYISPTAVIGEGSVVMAAAAVQSGAIVGEHSIINTGAVVEHDCRLSSFVHISPNATLCGGVAVGEGSWVGAGATVLPGVRIGEWSVIGAGATVVHDVPSGMTVKGVW